MLSLWSLDLAFYFVFSRFLMNFHYFNDFFREFQRKTNESLKNFNSGVPAVDGLPAVILASKISNIGPAN